MIDPEDVTAAWRDLGRQLATWRKAAGYTQQTFAPITLYGRSTIANVETGHQQPDRAFWVRCDEALSANGTLVAGYDQVLALARRLRRHQATAAGTAACRVRDPATAGAGDRHAGLIGAERIRRSLDQAIGGGEITRTDLDEWELISAEHARGTRFRSPEALLGDLVIDAADLPLLLHGRRHSATSLRRLTIVTAQLAGLISLTLLKLNDATGARQWGRTARRAAADAADPVTSSWVWAQEAYRHFYAGDLAEAATVAQRAQNLAGGAACVGVCLAAALEARAHAAAGATAPTCAALDRAEQALTGLDSAAVTASAFGYDEAQLRFHEGNAYTHLGNTAAAYRAQHQALQLYPSTDFLDRALVRLDRAQCLTTDGDITTAAHQAVAVLSGLSADQRTGLLMTRASEIYQSVPAPQRTLAPVREFRETLALPSPRAEEHL